MLSGAAGLSLRLWAPGGAGSGASVGERWLGLDKGALGSGHSAGTGADRDAGIGDNFGHNK